MSELRMLRTGRSTATYSAVNSESVICRSQCPATSQLIISNGVIVYIHRNNCTNGWINWGSFGLERKKSAGFYLETNEYQKNKGP